jgi:hypothetical protein|tara:strand:+ start:73 stop:654 length:582 start_codon:yes stop_codon:yes gene_type:complete
MNEVLNVWSPYVFDKITELMTSPMMPWYVCITDYYNEDENPHNHKWQHIAYHKDVSDTYMAPWLTMAVGDAISRSGQNLDEIIRVRCSTTTITPENHVADPHVDTDFPHMTALFYLNDSDGDTIVYKDVYDESKRLDQTEYYKQYVKTPTVDYTVTPQANKMCWFNGLTYHSSNSPTTVAKRYIINVNYTIKA